VTQPGFCIIVQSGTARLEIGQRVGIERGETGDMIARSLHQRPRGAGQ